MLDTKDVDFIPTYTGYLLCRRMPLNLWPLGVYNEARIEDKIVEYDERLEELRKDFE